MKNNNTNNIIIIVLFLTYIFATGLITIKNNIYNFKNTYISITNKDKYKNSSLNEKYSILKNNYENIITSNILGKYDYIDIYGLTQKMMFKNVVEDVDNSKRVIKLSNGSLTFIYPKKNVNKWVNQISAVSEYSNKNDIYMLYVNAPWRIDNDTKLPFYIRDYVGETTDKFLTGIKNNKVKVLDLREKLEGNSSDWFFNTDHHWKIETAFNAYEIIMKELDKNIDINLESKYLTDFDKKEYDDMFIGTYGKRVGKYYGGVDNYTYILPSFKTNLEVINYIKPNKESSHLVGSFKNVLTYKEYLITDELDREMSTYYTYGEGTKAEIRIKNHNAYNDKKIIILKDSFADPVYPFISLNFKETRVLDIRNYPGINLYTYIDEFKPNAIIFIHTPTGLYNKALINFELK